MTPEEKTEMEVLKQRFESLNAEFHLNNFEGSQDVNKYVRHNYRLKVPHYAVAPTTCEVGEVIEVAGDLQICSATDTWTVAGTQS
jgi:hypothetical protein